MSDRWQGREFSLREVIAINEEYADREAEWNEEEKRLFVEFIDPRPGERILDLGCGNGLLSRWCADGGAEVFGADVSFLYCGRTRNRLNARGKGRRVFQCEAQALPFASGAFDKVIFVEVLEHIPAYWEEAVLREIWRVLRPEGILKLHTSPNPLALKTYMLLNPLFALLGKARFVHNRDDDRYHINIKTRRRLNRLLRRVGFGGRIEPYYYFQVPRRIVGALGFLTRWPFNSLLGLRFRGGFVKREVGSS